MALPSPKAKGRGQFAAGALTSALGSPGIAVVRRVIAWLPGPLHKLARASAQPRQLPPRDSNIADSG
jgi:hypothetical protein